MLIPVTPRSTARQSWDRSVCRAHACAWSLQPCLECPFVTPCLSALGASELRALRGHNRVYFVVFLCVTCLHFHFSFPAEPCFPPVSPSVPAAACPCPPLLR